MTTIQPLSTRREISVTEPIEPAYDRVKLILFRPFDLTRWVIIGFCAWLAGLGEAGGGCINTGGFNLGNHERNDRVAQQAQHAYHAANDYVLANLAWIIPVLVVVVLVVLMVCLLIIWLSSHGKFMFLKCVALNDAEIEGAWTKLSGRANRLFWVRLGLSLLGTASRLPLLILLIIAIVDMARHGHATGGGIVLAVAMGLALFGSSIAFALIRKFTMDFVVPIMYLRDTTTAAAWREFWKVLTANPAPFIIYILFQIALAIALSVIISTVVLFTCCIAGCFMAIPFVGTLILLPILIFKRAYSLYFLAQFGPQFDVFPQSTPEPPSAPPAQPMPFTPGA